MEKYISIKEAGTLIGVTTMTLRRWEKSGHPSCHHRTVGNHRRYALSVILGMIGEWVSEDRVTVCYSRVSSHDQKEDLTRQTEVLRDYCENHDMGDVEVIEDIGSGLNFKKKGLDRLIWMIIGDKVEKLILTHRDRLLRFGSDLIINLASHFGTETIILNERQKTFEEELALRSLPSFPRDCMVHGVIRIKMSKREFHRLIYRIYHHASQEQIYEILCVSRSECHQEKGGIWSCEGTP